MSALPQHESANFEPRRKPVAKVALLGLGTVGKAVIERLQQWNAEGFAHDLQIVHVANSRHACGVIDADVLNDAVENVLNASSVTSLEDLRRWRSGDHRARPERASLDDVERRLGADGVRIVIDATASADVTERQRQWLARGIHVVTACKLGQGTELERFIRLQKARALSGAQYGDSATVGAGLPVIRSIRELREGGDRVRRISGVLSGSLAWLFNNYDGMRPFSGFVSQAGELGYTEPDPRDDLSGQDVRRKLLILARSAGVQLNACDVTVQSLVPDALRNVQTSVALARLQEMDTAVKQAYAEAYKRGEVLRYLANLEQDETGNWKASVSLHSLRANHPLAGGAGTDNRVAIWSDRYCEQPLVIQGPGAGARVTAAGLLDDALKIARNCSR